MNILKALLVAIILTGCASSHQNGKNFVTLKSESSNCRKVAVLKSSGFSLVPFLGKYIATPMLEDKAKSMNANAIIITKESGFFTLNLKDMAFVAKIPLQLRYNLLIP